MSSASSVRILIFDSGVGGLSVAGAVRERMPEGALYYLADRAGFPYGALGDDELIARVAALMETVIPRVRPHAVIIACNTASTLVLGRLRQSFSVPFVGTVPAIKPAAAMTTSGIVGVLATPGTVARDYTRQLIADFAGNVEFVLHGAHGLAGIAEEHAAGRPVDLDAVGAAIAPVFVEREGRRCDTVVLGCTHYPLLERELKACAPWPVTFLNPAEAIARRAVEVCDRGGDHACEAAPGTAFVTAEIEEGSPLAATFASHGFAHITMV